MLTKHVSSMRVFAPALLLFVVAGCGSGGDAAAPTAPTAPVVPTFQITGRVVDASAGINLGGVTLSAVDGANVGKQTVTAPDGRYTLTNLVTDTFTLRARREGYEDHLQAVSLASHTSIDLRLTPGRTVSSGWVGGEFLVTFDGERISTRVTAVQVTQNGSALNGVFSNADGSHGTFTGQLTGTRFTGSMQVEIVGGTPTRRCRGSVANVTGTATGDHIALAAAAVAFETCSGSATNLVLTITP